MANFVVVSYYTKDTLYEKKIRRLIRSLVKFNLPYDIEAITSLGSWLKNVHYKPEFCKRMLKKHNKPILFVDADAVIKRYPELFDHIQCDMAVHYRQGIELLSGTLYFSNTPSAMEIIEFWSLESESKPLERGQKNLETVAARLKGSVRVEILPANYCQIYDTMRDAGKPVIEHYQASRRYLYNITKGRELLVKFKYLCGLLSTDALTISNKFEMLHKYFMQYKKRYFW